MTTQSTIDFEASLSGVPSISCGAGPITGKVAIAEFSYAIDDWKNFRRARQNQKPGDESPDC
jgi:hypothetical protein